MSKISTEFLKTGRHRDTSENQTGNHWVRGYTSELISTEKFWSCVDWLDTCPASYQSLRWSSQFVSLQWQPCGKHLWEVSSSGYRATFIFHFVSRWLKSKLKVKRLISNEECVLPGISPAILSFPCVKGVKCSFGSRGDTWHSPADSAKAF